MQRQLDPDLLRTFVTIVEGGSFRRAAERIGRTQSAISMQMQRLEELAGGRLLERGRHRVRLTSKGETLLGYAHRILRMQDEALAALTDAPDAGLVRFGIPDDYAAGILPTILEAFAHEHPRMQMELYCATTQELVRSLDAGDLDVALVTRTPDGPPGQYLRREPLVWATSARRPVHGLDPLPVAVFQPDCLARQWSAAALDSTGRAYRIAYSSPNLAALVAVVEAGLAVAVMPAASVPAGLRTLSEKDGFPVLPSVDLIILRAAGGLSRAAEALVGSMLASIGDDGAPVGRLLVGV